MMTSRAVIFLMGGVIAALSAVAQAAYSEPCQLKYETPEGWSDAFEVECMYATGPELNELMQSFRFDVFYAYVVVFWTEDQASVIKIEGFTACAPEAKRGCADRPLRKLKGIDQDGIQWEVCREGASKC